MSDATQPALAAIQQRYREERDKRLRSDGATQYVEIEADSDFDVDPFVERVDQREPTNDEVEVVVVGAGIAGLLAAVHLRGAGIDDFRIVEKGGDFAGTWYWNRYPGLACDVESYIYMPLLEELGYMPTQRYATGAEVLEHCRSIAKHFSLYENALLQTRVTEVRWDEQRSRWLIETNRGDRLRARYLILGTGGLLHRPKLPGVPGLRSFEGHSFHTSRWDFSYTGGDSTGNLTGLRDKRVAIIGTGATAIQIVPHLAKDAKHAYVVQRTPSAIDIRAGSSTSPEWWHSLEPGWQKRRRANFEALLAGMPQEEDLVGDQWTQLWGVPPFEMPSDGSAPDMAAYLELVEKNDLEQMERIRARVDELVEDPQTAESLKPYFTTHCKRPCFNDSYLQSFNQPNVTLVDTRGKGVDRIARNAIHVGDNSYEVDCIIYATGFEAVASPARAGGFPVRGRGGVLLDERWRDGVKSLHGMYANGFPNMFIAGAVRQSALSINFPFIVEEQAHHIIEVIKDLRAKGMPTIEVTEGAERQWSAVMLEKSAYNEEMTRNCTPGFYNNEGNLADEKPLFADVYGGGPVEFVEVLNRWRDSGSASDVTLSQTANTRHDVSLAP